MGRDQVTGPQGLQEPLQDMTRVRLEGIFFPKHFEAP